MIKKIIDNKNNNYLKNNSYTINLEIIKSVSEIIENVALNGDKALIELTEKYDKIKLKQIKVSKDEIDCAFDNVDKGFISVLKQAVDNITEFHQNQKRKSFIDLNETGKILGQIVMPIEKIGVYVPGGTASYPSTVLMNVIPAKIAGVSEIYMVTPPDKEGKVNNAVLAAARIVGVKEIFKIGGAQAIAALAYGTETVPKVDKIVGPGNAFVAEAKRQVFGRVSIDMIAGPSEILVIADNKSDPSIIAADMLSQAEHDKMAGITLITDSNNLANSVTLELENQLLELNRKEICRVSVDNGKIIVVDNILRAIEISNIISPEHLELYVENPFDYLSFVKNAGSVFLGKYCPEAFGDYFAGPNHTLPTSGTARFSSALSVDDFIKKTQYIYYDKDNYNKNAESVALFAKMEGLEAHALSALSRLNKDE